MMKLILCKRCSDVVKLTVNKVRSCECGCCKGVYLDDLRAVYSGDAAIPLGFANSSLVEAIQNQPENSPGVRFAAFVIEKNCRTMTKVENLEAWLKENHFPALG